MTVNVVFKNTIDSAANKKLTRNAIAVHAKIRPATLHDLYNDKTKSISYETLDAILTAMNEIDDTRSYDISDVIVYENDKKDA